MPDLYQLRSRQWRIWLRHCATDRKVAGSIPDSVTGMFHWHNGPEVDSASDGNEYQGYFLGSKGGRCVGLTNLPPACADCLEIWKLQTRGTLGNCPDLYRVCFNIAATKRWNVNISVRKTSNKTVHKHSFSTCVSVIETRRLMISVDIIAVQRSQKTHSVSKILSI